MLSRCRLFCPRAFLPAFSLEQFWTPATLARGYSSTAGLFGLSNNVNSFVGERFERKRWLLFFLQERLKTAFYGTTKCAISPVGDGSWLILLYAGYPELLEPRPRPMKLSAHPSPGEGEKEAQPGSLLLYNLLAPPEKPKSGWIHNQPRDPVGFSPHPFPPPGSHLNISFTKDFRNQSELSTPPCLTYLREWTSCKMQSLSHRGSKTDTDLVRVPRQGDWQEEQKGFMQPSTWVKRDDEGKAGDPLQTSQFRFRWVPSTLRRVGTRAKRAPGLCALQLQTPKLCPMIYGNGLLFFFSRVLDFTQRSIFPWRYINKGYTIVLGKECLTIHNWTYRTPAWFAQLEV